MNLFKKHRFNIDTDSYEAEVTKLFQWEKKDTLLLGANFRKNCVDSDMFDGKHEQEIYGLFAEADLQLNSSIKATLGGRYDHHPLVNGNFSPRAGILFSLDDKSLFRLSYTTAYGLPTFTQSYLYVDRVFIDPIVGNRELDPEKIKSFNLGYNRLISNHIEIKMDAFYNEVEDVIRWPEDVSPPPAGDDRYRNVDSYTVRGAEVSLQVNVAKALDLRVNYAFINIDYSNRDEDFDESPESKFNAGFDYHSEKNFASLYAHYVSDTRWPAYATTPTAQYGYSYDKVVESYWIVNANLGVNISRESEISFYGYNILNEGHNEDPLGDKLGRKIVARFKYRF